MIYSLTDQLKVHKDILKLTRLAIKKAVFDYILIEKPNGKCVLCNLLVNTEFNINKHKEMIHLTKFNFINTIINKIGIKFENRFENKIENKCENKIENRFENRFENNNFFCEKCFLKIHYHPWPMNITINSKLSNKNRIMKLYDNSYILNENVNLSLESVKKLLSDSQEIKFLIEHKKIVSLSLESAKKFLSDSQEIKFLIEHEKFKCSKIKRKELIKNRIIYKMDIISEQLNLIRERYYKATAMKEDETAEIFRDLHNNILKQKESLKFKYMKI